MRRCRLPWLLFLRCLRELLGSLCPKQGRNVLTILQAGRPARRGQKGPGTAYSSKQLRDRERATVEREERAYAKRLAHWEERRPSRGRHASA